MKLIPFGVSSKIVMVVQNQDALRGAKCGLVKIRSAQARNTSAYNDEIIFLSNIGFGERELPIGSLTNAIELCHRSGVLAAQTFSQRRILSLVLGCRSLFQPVSGCPTQRSVSASKSNRNALQEIAPRYGSPHAEVRVFPVFVHGLSPWDSFLNGWSSRKADDRLIFAVRSLRPLEQPFGIVFHFTAAQSKAGAQFWKFIHGTRKRILVEC